MRGGQRDDRQPQRVPVKRAAEHERLALTAGAELLGDVAGDPELAVAVVARTGMPGGRPRAASAAAGSRPEVMPPVGDAVGLVDDEHPGGRRARQHLVTEAGLFSRSGLTSSTSIARGDLRVQRSQSPGLAELMVRA